MDLTVSLSKGWPMYTCTESWVLTNLKNACYFPMKIVNNFPIRFSYFRLLLYFWSYLLWQNFVKTLAMFNTCSETAKNSHILRDHTAHLKALVVKISIRICLHLKKKPSIYSFKISSLHFCLTKLRCFTHYTC